MWCVDILTVLAVIQTLGKTLETIASKLYVYVSRLLCEYMSYVSIVITHRIGMVSERFPAEVV